MKGSPFSHVNHEIIVKYVSQHTKLLACNGDEEMSDMEEKVIAVMCNWILN